VSAQRRGEAWLRWLWWLLFPSFAWLVTRMAIDRACADPYLLLADAASNPAFAWPLALVYVAAHWWMLGAYLMTAHRAAAFWPGIRAWRDVWGSHLMQIFLMAAVFVIEYAPLPLGQLVIRALACPELG
jgi:hypothetical protein